MMMKRHSIPLVLLPLLLGACGSSRKVATVAPQEVVVPAPQVQATLPEAPRPTEPPTAAQLLTTRIDSLLLTADTLLQQTQLGLHIVDLSTGEVIYARGERQRMRPASAEKVVTAVCALDLLGPGHRLRTQLLTTAAVSGHTLQGDLYLRGAMDPLLSAADVRGLASRLRAAGITRINGRLLADASLKDTDAYGWGWCWDDENPTLSPLLCGGKPTLVAQLRTALKSAGITLVRGTATGTAPASARVVASCERPLTEVLQPMLKESDNLCAEAVFYQMGRTRRSVVAAMRPVLADDPAPTIADGSGLSLYNYQTPATFTRLLAYAASRPDSLLLPLLQALPIAAVDGTLKKRMDGTAAAANVRAKTGSVTAVSTLVGYTTQRSTGHLVAFAILSGGLPRMAEGRALQDEICILLSQ